MDVKRTPSSSAFDQRSQSEPRKWKNGGLGFFNLTAGLSVAVRLSVAEPVRQNSI